MRSFGMVPILLLGLAGCASDGGSAGPTTTGSPKAAALPGKASKFTKQNNPTALAGRGEPSLEDAERPAAWIYIDGKPGKFVERDGHRLIEWVIEEPVRSAPTFRVEGYEPLIGDARDFKCVLRNLDSTEGTQFVYGITANPGTFSVGTDYPLTHPGDSFIISNGLTGDVVRMTAPLAPGKYAIAAGIENAKAGKKALAVSYFTVGESK